MNELTLIQLKLSIEKMLEKAPLNTPVRIRIGELVVPVASIQGLKVRRDGGIFVILEPMQLSLQEACKMQPGKIFYKFMKGVKKSLQKRREEDNA